MPDGDGDVGMGPAKRKAKDFALAADEACQYVALRHAAPLFTSAYNIQGIKWISHLSSCFCLCANWWGYFVSNAWSMKFEQRFIGLARLRPYHISTLGNNIPCRLYQGNYPQRCESDRSTRLLHSCGDKLPFHPLSACLHRSWVIQASSLIVICPLFDQRNFSRGRVRSLYIFDWRNCVSRSNDFFFFIFMRSFSSDGFDSTSATYVRGVKPISKTIPMKPKAAIK